VHFLLGILKLMDPAFTSQLDGLELSKEQRSRLSALPPRGRQYLEMKTTDIAKLRRGIRKELRSGKQAHSDIRQLHRSSESRQIFSRLADIALQERQPCVDVMQLLQEIVLTGAVDIEKAWQQVTKKPPSDGARRKWSTGARWEILGGENCPAGKLGGNILTDLSRLAQRGELIPVLGREREELSVCRLLNRTTKRNVLLIGEFGSGRRAIVEGLAQMACAPNARKEVARLRFYNLDLRRLLLRRGSKGFVSLTEEVAKSVVDRHGVVLIEDPEFDEILSPKCPHGLHVLMDVLLSDSVGLVLSVTAANYETLTRRYAAQANAFQVIEVDQPSPSGMKNIVDLWAERIEAAQGVKFTKSARRAVVEFAPSLPTGVLPEKAIDLLDNVAAYARVRSLSSSDPSLAKGTLSLTDRNVMEVIEEHYGISGH